MPCTIKIRLVEARGLPVVERASKVADAYVDITFASFEARSTVSKKSLTPRWDEEFRFDVVDDAVLQSQPIMFKVMDHDVYTTDATIGIVYVDLNCILMKEGCSVQGWYPIYDTLLGVRGELHLVIRLHYFGDINPFRESSAGVQFFSLSTLDPAIFTTQRMLGFVEELVVHADPEYSWSDSFRTSRKSNEYRQLLLYKLSSQVSTMVRNVLYISSAPHPHVSGMVARACGTAVFLVPTTDTSGVAAPIDGDVDALISGLLKRSVGTDDAATLPSPSVDAAAGSADQGSGSPRLATMASLRKFTSTFKPQRTTKTFELGAHDEIQLLTVKAFHPDTRVRLGGIVTARSVKFLGKMATKLADQETRDSWWLELREEVRAHAQSLQCSFVIGYNESCTIHDDVCVMSACGTAAVVKYPKKPRRPTAAFPPDATAAPLSAADALDASPQLSRSAMRMVRCGVCGRKWVPEMLLCSTEPLCGMAITGSGTFIQARVCRQRRRGTGDANATIVSEALPFLEYEMHRQCVVPPEFKAERAKIDSDDRLGHKRALRKLKKKDDVIERKPSMEGTVEVLVVADEDKGSSSDSSSESDDEVVNSDSNGDNKHPFVLEIDDETDEDLMSVLLEQPLPEGVSICNTDSLPGTTQHGANIHLFLSMKRVEWDEEHTRDTRVNVLFSHVFKMLFTRY
ncbi:hypothetical protein B5M09_002650 [Aphanomyces astaci]|uniref:C2 domain-containing protein n=1 Tax=Aphanomyces astaci TaxID=112090 RepID=A0A3R8D9Y0_APHAT|nr:hypothetical protein B5M09_002650 [Aphanomyces astaci]